MGRNARPCGMSSTSSRRRMLKFRRRSLRWRERSWLCKRSCGSYSYRTEPWVSTRTLLTPKRPTLWATKVLYSSSLVSLSSILTPRLQGISSISWWMACVGGTMESWTRTATSRSAAFSSAPTKTPSRPSLATSKTRRTRPLLTV